jgi:LuxR family glucitol operon transcriptional activator
VLSEQRVLLILDNLETADDNMLMIFLHDLPDPTKAIVTTRHRIDVAYPVRLTGMPHDDATVLIQQEAARKNVELGTEEQEQLWARTGGVPLAIVWSIGLMGLGGSAESVLRRLGQGQSDIARFCFEESVAQIRGRDAHKLLLALALFEASVSRAMLGEVAGLDEDELGRDLGLQDLLRLSLANKESDRFALLPLTRLYALQELTDLPELEQIVRNRWLGYLTEMARQYSNPNWRRPDRACLRQEGMHLVTLLAWALQANRPDIWLPILPAVSSYYNTTGQWAERLSLGKLGLDQARLIGDSQRIVAIEARTIAWVLTQQDNYKEAEYYLREALDVAAEIGSIEWQCEALIRLSRVSRRDDNFEQARAWCLQARNILANLEDPTVRVYVQADIEYEQGRIARDQGDWVEAEQHFLASRALFSLDEENPVFNRERAWAVFTNLGIIAHEKGDLGEAEQIYAQCLEYFKESGSKQYIILLLIRMASLEQQRRQPIVARSYATQALESSKQLGMKREQAQAEALLARLGV